MKFFLLLSIMQFLFLCSEWTFADDSLAGVRPRQRPENFPQSTSINPRCPPSNDRQYVGTQTCYDESIFREGNVTNGERRSMLRQMAPVALYLQELTGYPASVIVAQIAKEQGWSTTAPGNNFYGINCISRGGSASFQTPNGRTLSYTFNGCGARGSGGLTFQNYRNAQESMIGYIHLLLFREEASRAYGPIRRAIPGEFPPPGDRVAIINSITQSPYCQHGCRCNLGNRMGSYGECMNSHIRHACLSELDSMTLCNYDIPQLSGLDPLFQNIEPSNRFGSGTRDEWQPKPLRPVTRPVRDRESRQ